MAQSSPAAGSAPGLTSVTRGAGAGSGAEAAGGDGGGAGLDGAGGGVTTSNDNEFDFLKDGEKIDTSVTYTITDEDGNTDTATYTVRVFGRSDGPEITNAENGDTVTVTEGETAVFDFDATDEEGDAISWSVVESFTDGVLFEIDADGALSFIDAPDFEAPDDSGANNVYNVRVRATDTDGEFENVTIKVVVEDDLLA